MPGVQELSQQIRSILDIVLRFVKARRREEATIAFAALLLWFGYKLSSWLPTELAEFLKPWRGVLIAQIVLYSAGLALLVYGFWRIKRLVWVEPLPPGKDRPSAIKGPMAFTEADGELFRKLGRESELQKLLGLALDDQVLLIVIRGASGAGKTSLLRAGLKHILGDRAIFHYWEAVPTEADKGLLRAIQEKWPEGTAKPASLEELVNPANTLGRQSHVIVLDQFEQMRGNRKLFALLRRILRESKPPHRITWVIAFRREFSADWMDFVSPEIERGIRPPQDVSLRLFTADQAREVIGQLVNESNLKDSIEQSVINNLVEAATVESEVSPVDIGIGLLVLAELHERQSGQTITIRDYQFAGGAEGLLTQYISRCLELFPNPDQEAILKAMLALRDAETNQRLAEGRTVDELAAESGAEARALKTQLDRLSHRDTRLLETVAPADGSPLRYRLPHERLIPALYRLTGKLLAEVDQAKLKFQNAFQAWKTNDKRSAYLLKAKELRLVERYESQIPWGNDEQEKKGFLRVSQRRRTFLKGAATAAVTALAGGSWASYLWYQRSEGTRYLRESGYPEELYDWQHQLKKLELTGPLDLERFTWLSSQSIEELLLRAAESSNSLAGLASLSRCRSLKKLTLYLNRSQVIDLTPIVKLSQLTQLTLNLRGSDVRDLRPLEELQGLTQLTLDLSSSRVSDLKPLERLKGLTQLTLKFGDDTSGSSFWVRDLKILEQLKRLTHLTLDLRSTDVSDLKPLGQLRGLSHLTLDLRYSQVSDLRPLDQLTELTQLTIDMRDSKVFDWQPLERFLVMTQPVLDLISYYVSNSRSPEQLRGLKQLTLSFYKRADDLGSQEIDLKSLEVLKELTQLKLYLNSPQVGNIEPLAELKNLTQLTLSLNSSGVFDLKPLEQLNKLTQLTLDLSTCLVRDLKPLEHLERLTQLSLILSFSQITDLTPLERLKNLTHLELHLTQSPVQDLRLLVQLKSLTELKLYSLPSSYVNDFKLIEQLKELRQLTISLFDLGFANDSIRLETLTLPASLQSLSIESATRAQRMSLRKIPTSLTELEF
ncbi:MAG: twin-arginine translocation signal domain-containing protein [Blastocatellales bacterium]